MSEGIAPGTIRINLSDMKITQEKWDKIFKTEVKKPITKKELQNGGCRK